MYCFTILTTKICKIVFNSVSITYSVSLHFIYLSLRFSVVFHTTYSVLLSSEKDLFFSPLAMIIFALVSLRRETRGHPIVKPDNAGTPWSKEAASKFLRYLLFCDFFSEFVRHGNKIWAKFLDFANHERLFILFWLLLIWAKESVFPCLFESSKEKLSTQWKVYPPKVNNTSPF